MLAAALDRWRSLEHIPVKLNQRERRPRPAPSPRWGEGGGPIDVCNPSPGVLRTPTSPDGRGERSVPIPRDSKRTEHALARRPSCGTLLLAVGAGALWGVTVTAALAAMAAWQCGGICLSEVAVNGVLSIAGGLFGIGPVVAFGRRSQ